MLKILALATTFILLGSWVAPVLAEESRKGTVGRATDNGDGLIISNPGASAPGEDAPAAWRASRGGPSRRDTPITGGEVIQNAANANFAANADIPPCSDEPEPTATPAQIAEAFLRTVPLSPPAPEIAPDGQAITGLAAFYTVTLRQRWSATWSLGGDSGTVEGLLTETTVPVEVFEVQAVIRR
jgi:hypothetical protein